MNCIIDDDEELYDLCQNILLESPVFIALDTEFVSSHKYKKFPKLCLIQICYNEIVAIIDVTAPNINLSHLKKIFFNPDITKVFHDFKQDTLALLTVFHYIPWPIMDTQIMAMLCYNLKNTISYSELVFMLLNVKLPKNETRTNWLKRPLTKKQIEYAFSDVLFLHSVYKKLHHRLSELKRLDWVMKDMQGMVTNLSIPYSTKNELPNSLRRVLSDYRDNNKLAGEVSDFKIYCLSYKKYYTGYSFDKIIKKEYRDVFYTTLFYKRELSYVQHNKGLMSSIQKVLRCYCLERGISYQMVSSTSEINRLLDNNLTNIRLLSGWRYDEIGNEVIKLLKKGRSATYASSSY